MRLCTFGDEPARDFDRCDRNIGIGAEVPNGGDPWNEPHSGDDSCAETGPNQDDSLRPEPLYLSGDFGGNLVEWVGNHDPANSRCNRRSERCHQAISWM